MQSLSWELTGATTGTGMGSFSTYIFNVGTKTVRYLVSDCRTNAYSCDFTVTINNTSHLAITCPQNVSVCAPVNQNFAIVNNLRIQLRGCGAVGLSYFYLVSGATSRIGWTADASGVFNVGFNIITYTMTDAAGNSVTCNFIVEIYKQITANAGLNVNACE